MPITGELTYGIERLAMYLQNVDNMFDLQWDKNVTYGQIRKPWEVEYSTYQFEELKAEIAFANFDTYEAECRRLLARSIDGVARPLVLPAYEFCMKASHAFNCLQARGAISVTERQRFIGRVRGMAKAHQRRRHDHENDVAGRRQVDRGPPDVQYPAGRQVDRADVEPLAERHVDLVRVPRALEDHPADVGCLHHSRNRVSA